jgi:hypothetical protein
VAAGGKGAGPSSVAEGLGDVLRAVVSCMQAPDAVHFAGPLMKLQTGVLDLIHGQMRGGAPGGAPGPAAPGAAPGGPPGAAPPGGAGGASPLMGGIAGLQGGPPQGPSAAVSGMGPSMSGMDPEALRQAALVGSEQ